jgi:hypothetical protein
MRLNATGVRRMRSRVVRWRGLMALELRCGRPHQSPLPAFFKYGFGRLIADEIAEVVRMYPALP